LGPNACLVAESKEPPHKKVKEEATIVVAIRIPGGSRMDFKVCNYSNLNASAMRCSIPDVSIDELSRRCLQGQYAIKLHAPMVRVDMYVSSLVRILLMHPAQQLA
jgi:hypothetical protein